MPKVDTSKLKHGTIQMTTYNAEGQKSVVVTSHITGVKNSPNGMEADFNSQVVGEDGKVMDKGQGHVKCQGAELSVNIQQSMPSGSMEQFKNMEVKALLPWYRQKNNFTKKF